MPLSFNFQQKQADRLFRANSRRLIMALMVLSSNKEMKTSPRGCLDAAAHHNKEINRALCLGRHLDTNNL